MGIVIREANNDLGAEEKMIALKILLVIYLHDKRYFDALADIEELLNDPEMQSRREYLLLRQEEVRQTLACLSKKERSKNLQFILNFFNNSVCGVKTFCLTKQSFNAKLTINEKDT